MEINVESMILGMGIVLLLTSVVAGVVAFVRTGSLKRSFDDVRNEMCAMHDEVNRRIDEVEASYGRGFDELRSEFDSRTDKLMNQVRGVPKAVRQSGAEDMK